MGLATQVNIWQHSQATPAHLRKGRQDRGAQVAFRKVRTRRAAAALTGQREPPGGRDPDSETGHGEDRERRVQFSTERIEPCDSSGTSQVQGEQA